MRVLMTGASGYIGRRLTPALVEAGFVEAHQGVGQGRVIVQISIQPGHTAAPGVQ